MLTHKDLKLGFAAIKLITNLRMLPLDFDAHTGKFTTTTSKRTKIVSKIWQYLAFLRTIHLVVASGMAACSLDGDFLNLEEMPIILNACFCFSLSSVLTVAILDMWIPTFIVLWNHALEFFTGPKMCDSRSSKRSLNEIFLCYFPYTVYTCIAAFPIFYVVRPKNQCLVVYSLRWMYKQEPHFLVYLISVLVEVVIHFYLLSFLIVVVFFMMATLISAGEIAGLEVQLLRACKEKPRELHTWATSYKRLKTLQLQISLFNISSSKPILLLKLICLMISVSSGFAAIKLIARGSLIAIPNSILFINTIFPYVIVFKDAFFVTEKITELKRMIDVITMSSERFPIQETNIRGPKVQKQWFVYFYKKKQTEYNKSTRGVSIMQIKSGEFSKFEKNFALEFLNFIVARIVDLLLAF